MTLPSHYVLEDGVPAIVFEVENDERELIPLPDGFFGPDSARHAMLWIDGDWVEDVEGERAVLWAAVKQARDVAIGAGCNVPGLGRVQTDAGSRAAINERFGAAAADPGHWSSVWTMEDNSDEPVDYAAMRSIKLAVDAHVEAKRVRARDLRDQLNEAGTLAELRAVDRF